MAKKKNDFECSQNGEKKKKKKNTTKNATRCVPQPLLFSPKVGWNFFPLSRWQEHKKQFWARARHIPLPLGPGKTRSGRILSLFLTAKNGRIGPSGIG